MIQLAKSTFVAWLLLAVSQIVLARPVHQKRICVDLTLSMDTSRHMSQLLCGTRREVLRKLTEIDQNSPDEIIDRLIAGVMGPEPEEEESIQISAELHQIDIQPSYDSVDL